MFRATTWRKLTSTVGTLQYIDRVLASRTTFQGVRRLQHESLTKRALWEIAEVPGKGLGVVASQDLPAGTPIMDETALITASPGGEEPLRAALLSQYPTMPAATQARIQRLFSGLLDHDRFGSAPPTLSDAQARGVVRFNTFAPFDHVAMTTGNDASIVPTTGLWLSPSFLNHACSHNAFWHTPTLDRMVVRTVVPVAKGTELTIAYRNAHDPFALRALALRERYAMTCMCPVCTADRRVSETDRAARSADMERLSALATNVFEWAAEVDMDAADDEAARGIAEHLDQWLVAHAGSETYRPHDVRYIQYLLGCVELYVDVDNAGGRSRAADRIVTALVPTDLRVQWFDEEVRGSAPDWLFDLIRCVRTAHAFSAQMPVRAQQALLEHAAKLHDVMFGGGEEGFRAAFGELAVVEE
ncbi:hypothetical protein AMAG_06039 [Allomyces macrogynus ATCC 38327]|uniref:SET domain-containing protein n=1 Tax=Allomyces macrogynus (strain ATCC 38327) TaxID=578462 RepID=A0A0L0SDN8_ALLM3|nr:hypothetical protein AMAG_06039 [Allomyces macrogynus ATCC 38327]|eukprot:KNE60668.1 hypothetical protein AMAG_06039 [Allomyces macrogynus ATCC 38327]